MDRLKFGHPWVLCILHYCAGPYAPMMLPTMLTAGPLGLCLLLQEAFPSAPWFASLGVGGVLAGGMFLYYRQDSRASQQRAKEERESAERRYVELAQNFRMLVQENTKAIDSNTATGRETLRAIDGLRDAVLATSRRSAGVGN